MNRTKKNDLGRKYAESETKKEGFPFRHWKVIAFYLVLYDIVAVNFSYFFGLLIRQYFLICVTQVFRKSI